MNRREVLRLLERLKDLKILVVGDVILDRYLYGRVERISPEAPVPVVEVEGEEVRLGGAGNVAGNLVSLGVQTSLTGVVGEDRAGELLRNLLKEKGIKSLLTIDARPTTEKTRVISRSQQLLRIDFEDRRGIGGRALDHIKEVVAGGDYDGIVVSDYAKGVVTPEVMGAVKDRRVFYAVDPRPVNRNLYRNASLMTPNEKELRAMTDPLGGESVENLGRRLREELSLNTLIVTRGPKGMTLIEKEVKHFPARAREVYDVTGAGDTVVAALTAFFLAGASWETACELANVCAGIVVGELGTASVTPEELLRELDEKGL
ncbi:MAG TPA: D-glycero-beta-D-manno-heptose-7-phosphate kinase [Aquifex aeolicus]|uniref:D-glycero-beta-D-manno-heptose-7-phosphate kinase n=1 Tax=Aquifex aeolicus TaxID=63363 RepID=A0A7C5QMI3_AQUAO|nr:D-glycero-beta-D-manno-heptose-7-phosphate kinase [Aquifex aeolicus]